MQCKVGPLQNILLTVHPSLSPVVIAISEDSNRKDNAMSNGATVITGATNIENVRLLTIEHGLRLQVKTGLGFTGNRIVNAAKAVLQNAGIAPKRTHKALLAQFVEYRAKFAAENPPTAQQ